MPVPSAHHTIPDALRAAAARSGDAPILTLLDASGEVSAALSYADLLMLSGRWRRHYRDLGLSPGDRIVVALRHGVDLYAAYLGALLGGYLPAMFAFPSPKVTEAIYFSTLRPLVSVTEPRLFVTFDRLAPQIAETLRDLPVRVVSPGDLPAESDDDPAIETSSEATAFVQYSSGTTGLKKGVEISHGALLRHLSQCGGVLGLRRDDVIVSWLPLYHDMGLICAFFLPLLTGTRVVAMDPFDWVVRPALLLEAITRHKGTLCWQPNFALALLARTLKHADLSGYDLKSMRAWVNCSETIHHESNQMFLRTLGRAGVGRRSLAACYGLAEVTFSVSMSIPGQPPSVDQIHPETWTRERRPVFTEGGSVHHLVSSGYPLPGVRIEIHDGSGQPLGEREVGEIVVMETPALARSYLKADAHGTRNLSLPLRTGDLGYMAAGELFVTGRAKDLIIVAGRNIFPQDAEAIAHDVPGVIAGRVVAFGVMDEELGTERLVLLIETTSKTRAEARAVSEEVRALLAGRLGLASEVVTVAPRTLRKSTSGKLSRAANREDFLKGLHDARLGDGAPETRGPGHQTTAASMARAAVADVLGPAAAADLADGDSLITSGRLASLDVVGLVFAIEKRLERPIPMTTLDIAHLGSITRIAELIEHLWMGKIEGPSVDNAVTLDDRQKAALGFAGRAQDIDLLMLGSSRTAHVSPRVAAAHGFAAFNFWMLSARAEDLYCAVRFALEEQDRRGGRLRLALLGIDAEAFTPTLEDVEPRLAHSTLLAQYLDPAHRPATASPEASSRLATLRRQMRLSREQPWYLRNLAGPRTDRAATSGFPAATPINVQEPDNHNALYALRYEQFDQLSPWRVSYFRRTLDLLASRGIGVICYVTPVHDVLDRFLVEKTPYRARLAEIEALVASHPPNVRWLDAGTANRFGGDPQDFLDGSHLGQSNGEQLTRFLLTHSRTAAAAIDTRPLISVTAAPAPTPA